MSEAGEKTKILTTVPELCAGCLICELVCSLNKTGVIARNRARIKVVQPQRDGPYTPVVCRHCKKPPCLDACPVPEAMTRNQMGVVVINEAQCIGCLACVDACPFGAIQVGPKGEVLKCDLCGGDPVCVKFCPWMPERRVPSWPWPKQSCLQYIEPDQVAANKRIPQVKAE